VAAALPGRTIRAIRSGREQFFSASKTASLLMRILDRIEDSLAV
jgi:hypothetical protein